MPCTKVAVLGAGVSGLAAIKNCLDEGMDVTAFESRPCVGGVWSDTTDSWNTQAPCMYRSLVTNTSKSMTAFSDFPCPASYPPYLPHQKFQEYIQSYVDHFRLQKHIKFNTRAISVRRSADHAHSGRWVVTLTSAKSVKESTQVSEEGATWEEEFDGVIVAGGFFSKARSPTFPGLESKFKGQVSHSCSYKDNLRFRDKVVLVVGNKSSAGDIATDVSQVAKQVYLSIGSGTCLQIRTNPATGLPNDMKRTRLLWNFLPFSAITRIMGWMLNRTCNHRALGILYTGPGGCPILVNDELQKCILSGKVKVIPRLKEFKATGVTLETCEEINDLDEVIFATGYERDISILDPSLKLGGNKLDLYKMVFPVHEKHHTLALVGCLRINGPTLPGLELQARMAAYVMSGRHQLPSVGVMAADSERYSATTKRPDGTYEYGFVAIKIMEEVAAEIGVAPHFWKLLFSGKPRLAVRMLATPPFPFIYRLVGPGSWSGAEAAINRVIEENYLPLRNRPLLPEKRSKLSMLTSAVKYAVVVSLAVRLLQPYFPERISIHRTIAELVPESITAQVQTWLS